MNLDEAIQKHTAWKVTFRNAISRKEKLDAETMGKDNCCQLGQWLYGDGRARYGTRPEFKAVVENHRIFHVEAGKVARLINAGQYDQVDRALGTDGPFTRASNAVCTAIVQLKRVAR